MMNSIARNEAEFCGKVPLHQTNLLQPHGYLFVIGEDFSILQAGENVKEILGKEVAEVVNTLLTQYMPDSSIEQLSKEFEKSLLNGNTLQLPFKNSTHQAIIKKQPGYYVVEVEKKLVGNGFIQLNTFYQQVRGLLQAIESSLSLEKFCQAAIKELKNISGFDKVMIYRFDENWNGDVIAEIMEKGMDAYLGLKFPSSDIPKQARDLYQSIPYRFIPNIDYEPVKLHPVINRITGGFTDLSTSNLRSVASVHLEYLENMKVKSSMSTRIMVNGKLWGLIACHHQQPKYLDLDTCAFFEIFSQVLSSRITWIQERHEYEQKVFFNELQISIIKKIVKNHGLLEGLQNSKEELIKLLSADGIAMVLNRQIYQFGNVPDRNDIEDLAIWIQSNSIDQIYHQPNMSSVFEPALDYSKRASGVLVLPLHKDKGDYILAFRPEAVTKANWGGNPDEALQFEPDGKKYHPRSSFDKWQQTVHHTSIPWDEQEIIAADNFMNFIRPLLYQKNLFTNN